MLDFSRATDCAVGGSETFATVGSGLRNNSTIESQATAPKATPPAKPPARIFQSAGQREAAADVVGDDMADTAVVLAAFAVGAGAGTATLAGALLVVGVPTIAEAATALGSGGRPEIDELALSGLAAARSGNIGGTPAAFFACECSVLVARLDGEAASPDGLAESVGRTTCTMLPHLGQARISPITDSSLTLSRARQVVH